MMNSSIHNDTVDISVGIPTYARNQVLIDTVQFVLEDRPLPREILVADQTPRHDPEVEARLEAWDSEGVIRWLRLTRPSVPAAMNHLLRSAKCPVVLFLDDDIVPAAGLIAAHLKNFEDPAVWGATGQILQPGQEVSLAAVENRGNDLWRDLEFPFNSNQRTFVGNCMAGNLSVRRELALGIGGFDENFVRLAYRFETEFCRRLIAAGGKMVFDPDASIRHLQVLYGGTRMYGHHRITCRPDHSVGEYYFAIRQGLSLESLGFIAYRMYRAVRTKHNFLRPWWIPLRLIAELRGLSWAIRLARRGPALVDAAVYESSSR